MCSIRRSFSWSYKVRVRLGLRIVSRELRITIAASRKKGSLFCEGKKKDDRRHRKNGVTVQRRGVVWKRRKVTFYVAMRCKVTVNVISNEKSAYVWLYKRLESSTRNGGHGGQSVGRWLGEKTRRPRFVNDEQCYVKGYVKQWRRAQSTG